MKSTNKGLVYYLENYEELEEEFEEDEEANTQDDLKDLIKDIFEVNSSHEPRFWYRIDPMLGLVMVFPEPVNFSFPAD